MEELKDEKRSMASRANQLYQIKNRCRRYRVGTEWRWLGNYWEHYPSLSFYGIWLELAGFEEGDEVEIEVKHNELVIRNLRPVENDPSNQSSISSPKKANNDDCPNQSQIKYP
ncbi:MAG: SymE family type I addiction module toxin [Bacteroidota bacterium]